MLGAVRISIMGLALAASAAHADGWVVFPIKGGAVAYYDSFLENSQTGTILLTVANYMVEPRRDAAGDYRFAFESWHVNCKSSTMKPEKVVHLLNSALPATIDHEFQGAQPWVEAGNNEWANLVVRIACTDAAAPNAVTVQNQPAAMATMAELGAGAKP